MCTMHKGFDILRPVSVSRTYIRVVLLEAAIIIVLVALGRYFS
jgi:hypothetical protein